MARPLSPEARRTALEHARTLLVEDGIAGLNFEALARHSGVAKTTLYRHWRTRTDLLHDALADLVNPMPTPDTGSLRSDLDAWIGDRPPPAVVEQGRRILFLIMEAAVTDPAIREMHDSLMAQRIEPTRTIITHAIERSELAARIDIDLAIDLVLGPLLVRTMMRELETDDRQVRALVDATIAALEALRP